MATDSGKSIEISSGNAETAAAVVGELTSTGCRDSTGDRKASFIGKEDSS